MIPIPLMLVVRSGRHFLLSFSTEGASLENILLKEMAIEI